MAKSADEVLKQAEEALRKRQAQQEALDDAPEPVAEVPALQGNGGAQGAQTAPTPFPDLSQYQTAGEPGGDAAPALEQAQAALSKAQQERGLTPESEKGVWSDVKTTAKIAALYPVVGKLARGEQEMGLRELTKNLVLDQVPDEDKAGLEALAKARFKKGLGDLKWRELDKIANDFYRNTDLDWRERLARMAGFRPGDEYWAKEMQKVEMGPDTLANKPGSGTPAFPMARELIEGSIKTGVGNFYEDFIRPVFSNDTPELAEEMVEAIERATQGYRAETKASLEKPMVAEDAIWYDPTTYFDEGTKDPYHDLSAFLHTAVQQSGNIVGMAVASRLGGGVGARYAMKRFGGGLDKFEDIQKLQKRGATIGGGSAGGAAEMSLIRDAVFSEAHQRISTDIKDEVWVNDPTYQRLVDGGLTPTEAKQIIAYEHANNAGNLAMLVSGALMGTPMGMFYGSLTGTSAGRTAAKESILRNMAKGALYETGQEMAQELSEQIAANLAVKRVDPMQDIFEGGLEAVVTAGLISGPYGALAGVRSEKGAGIAKAKDKLIQNVQPWVNAATERHKYQTKVGPDTKFAKDASPQDQLKAVVELERLQKKEAEEWLKNAEQNRRLMQETGASNKELVEFDARTAGYETDLAFIAKRQKARTEARQQQREERAAQKERAEAKAQVERDVGTINENMRMVDQMIAVQKGEALDEEQYEELRKLGYGTYTGRGDSNFVLTERGVRAMRELSKQADDLRKRIDKGETGPERRTRQQLRETYDQLSDEEFEEQVMKDQQTKLWNKRKLDEDLRDKTWGGAAFIDADALKWVNDNMSYSAGDEYLRTITRELEDLGKGIEVYRRGGDEFVVLGPNEDIVQAEVEKALKRISNAPRITEAGKSVAVGLSVGFGPDVGTADRNMKQEKQRRIETGKRADTRIEGAVPPSLVVAAENSPQMALFALAANSGNWDDDSVHYNGWGPGMWDEYVVQSEMYWSRKTEPELKKVDEKHFTWIEETISDFLPPTNTNNPPVTLVHDYHWLRELAPNQYNELNDLPFGAMGVRGLFSLDDPTHGVFLMADVILREARSGLRRGMRMTNWSSAKWTIKPGTEVEVIDENNNFKYGKVVVATYKKPYYQPTTRETVQEKRISKEAIAARQKLNKLAEKEINLMKQYSRMSTAKKNNPDHPLNKKLVRVLDEIGETQMELQLLQSQLRYQREKRWLQAASDRKAELEKEGTQEEDKVVVELRDGTQITFDPVANKSIKGAEEGKEWHIGRYKSANTKAAWSGNLGNEMAAQDEPLTKEKVQQVAADTLMHETVGHYGIRGITRDWTTYLELTHAIVDAFPELAENLRLMGYNYRDDLKRDEHLNAANKALLGEEIMAWLAGNRTSAEPNMNVTQRKVWSRFLTWVKQQLLNMGFNKLYRNQQAARIRKARRKLQRAKTPSQRDAAFEELYGSADKPGLVYVGRSGVRKSKWDIRNQRYAKGGSVIRAAKGFLNEEDLLNIVQRSLDFVRNGKQRWKFYDHLGNRHYLPMRDIEIFRKPVHYVMMEGTRERTEEEKLTKQDLEPLPTVPTQAEAYEMITGEQMPEGFKVLTPADFKDEAKRIEAEMSEGKTPEEIKEMRKKKVFPNPKQLYDAATQTMSQEQLELARRIQSEIMAVKKERERRENAVRSKKAKIDLLEKKWGKEAVENDQIPLFPEIGSINDYIDSALALLPSAGNKGHITQDELWASGLMERLWPSRFFELVRDDFVDKTEFMTRTGMTDERFEQLKEPRQQLTAEEAKALVDYLKDRNSRYGQDVFDIYPDYLLDERVMTQNNGLTAKAFREYVDGYNLHGADKDLALLIAVHGDGSKPVRVYEDAMKASYSNDPDEAAEARQTMSDVMFTPIDIVKTPVPKDWVLKQIESPVFEVSTSVARPRENDYGDSIDWTLKYEWRRHYKVITGQDPSSNWSDWRDIPDQAIRQKVYDELLRDVRDGPDVGYDEQLGQWFDVQYNNFGQSDWPNLMMPWIVPGSYMTHVFWQKPFDGVSTHHMSWATYRDTGHTGAGGIWGHTRVAAVEDADPNAPTAPNPARQGQAYFPFEFQADAFQAQAKMWATQEEFDTYAIQRQLDGMALSSSFQTLTSDLSNVVVDKWEEEWNNWRNNVTEEEVINNLFSGDDRRFNSLTATEKQVFMDIYAAKKMWNVGTAFTDQMLNKMKQTWRAAKDAAEPLRTVASGMQPTQQVSDFVSAPQSLDIKFIGDARNFEYMDERAVQKIVEGWISIPQAIETMLDSLRGIDSSNYVNNETFKAAKEAGGFIKFLKAGIPTDRRDAHPYHYLGRKVQEVTERFAGANDANQAGHRVPWMRATMERRLAEMLDNLEVRPRRNMSYQNMAKDMLDGAYNKGSYTIRFNYEDLSLMLSDNNQTYSGYDIFAIIEEWAQQKVNVPFWSAVEDKSPEATIHIVADTKQFEVWKQGMMEQFKQFLAVKLNQGDMSSTRQQLRRVKQKLEKKWFQVRNSDEIQQWKDDFQLQQAELVITEDENAPFAHTNEGMANGLSVAEAQAIFGNEDIETFDKYVQRKWSEQWNRFTQDERDEITAQGGDADTPTNDWFENYRDRYNDSKPMVIVGKVPIEWDQQSNATDWVSLKIVKKKVDDGDQYTFVIDGETLGTWDRFDVQNQFGAIVNYWYRNSSVPTDRLIPWRFPSLRPQIRQWKKEVKELQDQIDAGESARTSTVDDTFQHESMQPVMGGGPIKDISKAFDRIIKYQKKRHQLRPQNIMYEKWKTAQMLWSISEAIRQGYARMHLAPGSASSVRGGQTTRATEWWHHAHQVKYTLTQKEIRGEMRDILIVKADTVENPMWIDVTETRLPNFHDKERSPEDPTDINDAYMSVDVARELGRDVAEVLAQKLREAHSSPQAKRLLVTGSGDNWYVHETNGTVISSHPSKRAAQNARNALVNEEKTLKVPTFTGTISEFEVGGPIMFMRTRYGGSTQFQYTDSDTYQHTLARPWFAGLRDNYDRDLINKYRAYLKQFGLDIEEGYVKVSDSGQEQEAVYSHGLRKKHTLTPDFAQRYPNIRVEEVTGETVGYVIMTDNGSLDNIIYRNFEDADAALLEHMQANSVTEDGKLKLYQITFNDAIRREHSKPVNPYMTLKAQLRGNKHFESLLSKIGSDEPSLLDRFKAWRKTWRAAWNQGMFDRFYGIKNALNMVGLGQKPAEENGYIQARMTTGLDAMMRSVMEYGHPVWRDGVIEAEGKGLLKILEPVSNELETWAAYMAGRRAKRLIMEGYDKLDPEEQATLNAAAKVFEGSNDRERVFRMLAYASGYRPDVMPKATRREFLKMIGGLSAAASAGLPTSSGADQKALEIVGEALKGRPKKDAGRLLPPKTRFKNPEQAKYAMQKKVMDATGVDKDEAKRAIDRAINQKLEDQKIADAARRSKQAVSQRSAEMDAALDEAGGLLDKLVNNGREKLISPAEAAAGADIANDYPMFEDVAAQYANWNSKLLDFAEEAGVINAETRPLWENADYIPFYRIADERLVGPLSKTTGVANQNSPIKTLKGGSNNIGDLIHNIFMNATSLVDAAVKNRAALTTVDALVPTGMVRKIGLEGTQALIDMKEVGKILRLNGIDIDSLPENVLTGLRTMFALKAPQGDGIISVMRDGKKEYYQTEDDLLYRAMSAINMENFGNWMNLLRAPKRLLTSWVTLDPGFMAANFVRDTMSGWVLSRDHFVPMIGGLKGFGEAIIEGDTMRTMISSGAAFDSGFINQGDPQSTHRYIKRAMKDAGFQRTLLNTPRKLYEAWKRLGSATENANRIAVYEAAIRAGKSKAQALYESKDLMDFSMGGDWPFIQFLIQTVPFMGARMQGLQRLGRGAAENPLAFFMKGSMISLAGMALWFAFRDDERYKALQPWDKDTYFHWWIGDTHYRLPKGFEVGSIFNTIPERIFEYMYSKETDAGKFLMRRFGYMLAETFNMNPIPQTVRPMVESFANYNFFTGNMIESPWEAERLPEDRYRYYTSPTMIELAAHMPDGLDTVMGGKIKSPLHLQNLYSGYTGTIGRYLLMAADIGIRELFDYPVPPERMLADYPVLGRFYRGTDDEPRRTKYEEVFYRELEKVNQVMNSLSFAERELEIDDPRFDEIERKYRPYVELANQYKSDARAISQINREIRDIHKDPEMDKKEKRKLINELQREKNAIFKEAYEERPSTMDESEFGGEDDISTIIDNFDPDTPEPPTDLMERAPATAKLVAGISTMNNNQLARLAKASNYKPKPRTPDAAEA